MVRGAVSSRVDPPVFSSPGPPGGLSFSPACHTLSIV